MTNNKIIRTLESNLDKYITMYGVSGKEERVRKALLSHLNSLNMDTVKIDDYGNIHATKKYGESDTVIHLNAHMDTVPNTQKERIIQKIMNNSNSDKWYTATQVDNDKGAVLGADDRAGIAIILTLLEHLTEYNGLIKVSFYREEEIGCVGSLNSDTSFFQDADLSITFDRHGNSDIVVENHYLKFCTKETVNWLNDLSYANGYKYKTCTGGISDAHTVSEMGVNAINLSVGYYNEHTDNEKLSLNECYTAYMFGLLIIESLDIHKPDLGKLIQPVQKKDVNDGVDIYYDEVLDAITISSFDSYTKTQNYIDIPRKDIDKFLEQMSTAVDDLDSFKYHDRYLGDI